MSDNRSISMQELLDGLATTADTLQAHRVSYAVVGGMATSYRSQPRFTKDIDFLLQVPQIALPGLLESLVHQGYQFDQTATIREWTQYHMVVLSYHGIRVDWIKAVIPAYQSVLERSTQEPWLGRSIRVASVDGLILMKLLAARTQDWLDIENLFAAPGTHLDVDWICQQWQTVAGLDDPRMVRFLELVARVQSKNPSSGA